MALLTKEQIEKASDRVAELVKVPEWGGEVMVGTMTGTERDEWELALCQDRGADEKANLANLRARLCAMTLQDADGNLLFSRDDIDSLGKKSSIALERIFRVARKLNKLNKSDIDELTKNS